MKAARIHEYGRPGIRKLRDSGALGPGRVGEIVGRAVTKW
jgi:hypothetical protein